MVGEHVIALFVKKMIINIDKYVTDLLENVRKEDSVNNTYL